MKRPRRLILLPLITVVIPLLGSEVPEATLEHVRRGNTEFADRKYEKAERIYAEVGERIEDPGLIAFNRAVVYYRTRQYNKAESFFRRALSDATGLRRLHALRGLGCCLVQQNLGARPLREAIQCFRTCLDEFREKLDEEQRDNILNNLELAKLLLPPAEQAEKEHPQPDPQQNNAEDPNKQNKQPENKGSSQTTEGSATQGSGEKGSVRVSETLEDKAVPTEEQQGGVGNLPPIPDKAELVAISPEAAEAHLRAAAQRLQKKLNANRKVTQTPAGLLDK